MEKVVQSLDPVNLIRKIEQYPVLYSGNVACDKNERDEAWRCVVREIAPDYDEYSSKDKTRLGKYASSLFAHEDYEFSGPIL